MRKSPNREENFDEAEIEMKKPTEIATRNLPGSTHEFYNDGSGSQPVRDSQEFICPYDEDEDSIHSTFSANKEIIDWDNKDEFEFDYDDEDMFGTANNLL